MRILIVGGGIAGLTLANFLKNTTHKVDIIEKNKQWHLGYTFGIWHNGFQIIEKMGKAKAFLYAGYPLKKFFVCNGGREIDLTFDVDKTFSKYQPAYTQISRKKLHAILLDGIGSDIKMGMQIKSIYQEKDIQVDFSNGITKFYDLVVGADGINSQVRSLVFPGEFEYKYTDWRGWYFWIKDKINFPDGAYERGDRKRFFIAFPHDQEGWCGYVAVPMNHNVPVDFRKRKQFLMDQFKEDPMVRKLLSRISEDRELYPTDMAHIIMHGRPYKDRVVLIGDAAHGLEPVAGIGASMALEDAFVLSEEIEKSRFLNVVLNNFYLRRSPRIKRAQAITRDFWWATVAENGIKVRVREIGLRYFGKFLSKHFVTKLEYFFKEPA